MVEGIGKILRTMLDKTRERMIMVCYHWGRGNRIRLSLIERSAKDRRIRCDLKSLVLSIQQSFHSDRVTIIIDEQMRMERKRSTLKSRVGYATRCK